MLFSRNWSLWRVEHYQSVVSAIALITVTVNQFQSMAKLVIWLSFPYTHYYPKPPPPIDMNRPGFRGGCLV